MKLSICCPRNQAFLRNACVPEPTGTGAKRWNSKKSDTVPRLPFWIGNDVFKKIPDDITPVPEYETT